MDESWVHNYGKSPFTLFDDGFRENGLVVGNRCVVTVLKEGLEVFLCSGSITHCRCTDCENPVEIFSDVGVDDTAELGEHNFWLEVGRCVRSPDRSDNSSDIAIEVH